MFLAHVVEQAGQVVALGANTAQDGAAAGGGDGDFQSGFRKIHGIIGTGALALWILFNLGKGVRIAVGILIWVVAGAFVWFGTSTVETIGKGAGDLISTVFGWFGA